ncbi:MAG: energy transducer TonB [Gemmatimonadota bacterium]|nr:energy transducer TonB [Gemmatimonadota bacterium]MDE2985495.1 energy transducer TonB [Gemmatimonadota bacterium]
MIDQNQATAAPLPSGSANQDFKHSFSPWFWGSLSAATVMHFLVFAFWPSMSVADVGTDTTETPIINPPTEVRPPEPPPPITRPAFPVVAEALADSDVTLPDFDFNDPPPPPPPPPDAVDGNISDAPTWTDFDIYPFIRNREELQQALEREYPPFYRDAGIGGTARVWFFIDETGKVVKTQIHTSSGFEALDEAALRVSHLYEFSPAMNRDKPVPVWVSIDITFRTRQELMPRAGAAV